MAVVQTPLDPRTPTGALATPVGADAASHLIPMQPGKTYLVRVINGAGAPITVSIDDPASGAGAVEYTNVSVVNATARSFVFKRPAFGKTPTADVALTFSAVTTITVEAYGPLD